MSEPVDEHELDGAADDAEVVDAVPVPEGVPPREREQAPVTPIARGALAVASPMAVQAAAVAVTGFAAGAATVAVVRRRRTRKKTAARFGGGKGRDVRSSHSFLVDIHLLGRD